MVFNLKPKKLDYFQKFGCLIGFVYLFLRRHALILLEYLYFN